ncbi:hypothetical protein MAR_032252 [Mya arenaria]|uniref:Uncharacterized protein n=1 Tax=Mya arenaria TaxID=6604 RepID=A0ABY7F638_MYAAR|nr:hypothetical protein MAR_032252 [Mya arenaria]
MNFILIAILPANLAKRMPGLLNARMSTAFVTSSTPNTRRVRTREYSPAVEM